MTCWHNTRSSAPPRLCAHQAGHACRAVTPPALNEATATADNQGHGNPGQPTMPTTVIGFEGSANKVCDAFFDAHGMVHNAPKRRRTRFVNAPYGWWLRWLALSCAIRGLLLLLMVCLFLPVCYLSLSLSLSSLHGFAVQRLAWGLSGTGRSLPTYARRM